MAHSSGQGTPYQLGITGGIGAGKSMACRVFAMLGVPTYDADAHAKALMVRSEAIRKGLSQAFGANVYRPDGTLDNALLAKLAFADADALERLNAIVHPAVFHHYAEWLQSHSGAALVVKEAALLFESGSYLALDAVAMVHAPESERIARTMARSQMTEAQVRERMARQWPDGRKAALARHKLHNGEGRLLLPQVVALHGLLLHR